MSLKNENIKSYSEDEGDSFIEQFSKSVILSKEGQIKNQKK